MRIVPDDAHLEIECYLQNKDIGFVNVGQEAQVKIESFPFTRYGTINARVTSVARDAIPEPDAQANEGDPTKGMSLLQAAGAEHTQNLVFPVTLSPKQLRVKADGANVPLLPGMAVSVEIKTGQPAYFGICLLATRRNGIARDERTIKRREATAHMQPVRLNVAYCGLIRRQLKLGVGAAIRCLSKSSARPFYPVPAR